ncbi:MAG: discoidin domain-containing protein [Bacteroidota bacterium]
MTSEGAKVNLASGKGKTGKALVIEFDLTAAYGYTIARKDIAVDLPPNYQFVFDMKAETPANNFEFKIVDSMENVWWIKKLNVTYPTEWTRERIKKRHLTFAWGPSGAGEIRRVKAIEFVVSSGTGGKGKVHIDNFRIETIDDNAVVNARPSFSTSSKQKKAGFQQELGKNLIRNWSAGPGVEWFSIDFGYQKEIGGLVFDWVKGRHASGYEVQMSDDGREWTTVSQSTAGNGGRDYMYLHEQEGRFVKVVCSKGSRNGYALAQFEVKGPEFGASSNDFFTAVAKDQSAGLFPKYLLRQQNYWTVVGAAGDTKEALMNETGTIEVDKTSFSIEPFLFSGDKLVTWNDVKVSQSLEKDYLPIPSVVWKYGEVKLTVRTFAAGKAGRSTLYVTYRLEAAEKAFRGKLFLALRPFQVNPPWQWLNQVGGVSRIDSVRAERGVILVNDKTVIPMSGPTAFGATAFENGDVVEYLSEGRVPPAGEARDITGFASAALEYDLTIPAGSHREIHLAVPFHEQSDMPVARMDDKSAGLYVERTLRSTEAFWEAKLGRFQIELPPSAGAIINTVKSNLAYIFINQDGPGIQPGSRSYERSWMRDGSLTATALLQMGIRDEVRAYIDWYALYQFPSGKIPCVVDTRGGDPTNEHDSHGQFIYLINQYFNYTKDTTWLRGKFDAIVKTVRYIQSLRAERKTAVYREGTPEQRASYGLVPESISHEGYSSKPMHSYWDDFFILRGLKDATSIAGVLRELELEREFVSERDDFRKDLFASMRLTMKNHGIDYIPGCVELGDFDATSTTIGVIPVSEHGIPSVGWAGIPEPQLRNTFDRYYNYFSKRRSDSIDWKDYTPYETRVIGTFVYLDQKDRAHEATEYFMKDRRPAPWNHWAEVVYRDPRTPGFIGDMPHTWVGSDFIRSIRAMFVYEREQDGALVIGAGIPEQWIDEGGLSVHSLPTYFGPVTYRMENNAGKVTVELSGTLEVPAAHIILKSPRNAVLTSVKVNGSVHTKFHRHEVLLDSLPARVELAY